MGCSASLDRCRVSYLHRDLILVLPACSVVAMLMKLSLPTFHIQLVSFIRKKHEWVDSRSNYTALESVFLFVLCLNETTGYADQERRR